MWGNNVAAGDKGRRMASHLPPGTCVRLCYCDNCEPDAGVRCLAKASANLGLIWTGPRVGRAKKVGCGEMSSSLRCPRR
jgi:hypothetical protein